MAHKWSQNIQTYGLDTLWEFGTSARYPHNALCSPMLDIVPFRLLTNVRLPSNEAGVMFPPPDTESPYLTGIIVLHDPTLHFPYSVSVEPDAPV